MGSTTPPHTEPALRPSRSPVMMAIDRTALDDNEELVARRPQSLAPPASAASAACTSPLSQMQSSSSLGSSTQTSPLRAAAAPQPMRRPLDVPGGRGGQPADPGRGEGPSPQQTRPMPSAPSNTPNARRPVGDGARSSALPANHINLAAQLAQLDFGRGFSPASLRGFDYLDSPASSAQVDSPSGRPVQPYDTTPPSQSPLSSSRSAVPPPLTQSATHSGADFAAGGRRGFPLGLRDRRSESAGELTSRDALDEGGGEVVIDISPALNPYLLHYASPASQESAVVRCKVVRTRGKKRSIGYSMQTEGGEGLLTAVRRQDDFLISMSSSAVLLQEGGTADWARAQRFSFAIVRCPSNTSAIAEFERREFCAYNAHFNGTELQPTGEPLIAISHGTVMASASLPQVNTMRAAFPDPAAGTPLCTRGYLQGAMESMEDLAAAEAERERAARQSGRAPGTQQPPMSPGQGQGQGPPGGVCLLDSRVPVWNARTESYVLNFHGRATLASSKNVQLLHWPNGRPPISGAQSRERQAAAQHGEGERPLRPDAGSELPTLLYGKIDKDTYNLDYAFPLSAFHAFVIALSITDW